MEILMIQKRILPKKKLNNKTKKFSNAEISKIEGGKI